MRTPAGITVYRKYAPSHDYDGRFGWFKFGRHYYGRIGDFDSGEEFACAVWLDTQAQKGRIDFWVRNRVRKEGCSFFLQKVDGRLQPHPPHSRHPTAEDG